MDQGTESGADFQHLCQSRGIPPVVTDLETPWQISVIERHGALCKMAFEKACSLEAPTTEAEVNELIDFSLAELNRPVGRAGFSPSQRVFGLQLRPPSTLLEDDFIDPYMIAQDATHEMRRSEAMLMAAAHGCVVAADRRAMSTASHSRQRKPQRVLVAGEPVFIHRRQDGAQRWCGPGVCVLSEEPKPGRNETVWVHMRNCLRKCNRTQVRPATNEEAEGIETVTSLLPDLTEAVREGRTRHFANINDEGDPEDDEPMVVEGHAMDVRLGRPDSQPEPEELNARANSNASTSAGTDMEIGVGDRRVRFREERDSPRHHLDASSDRESMEEPRGKIPRRAETSESVVPFHSSEASSSELQQVSTAATSDNPTGERLHMSMTEEGPSEDYKITMQRDRHGRWMQTKGEITMNIQKAREERRNFYVGESKERLRRPRRAHCMGNFISVNGTPTRYLGTTFLPKSKRSFRKQSKQNGKEYSISRR